VIDKKDAEALILMMNASSISGTMVDKFLLLRTKLEKIRDKQELEVVKTNANPAKQ
jgi:hypothetical protein